MPEDSLRRWTQLTIRDARSRTAMGRAVQSAGEGGALYPDISSPAALTEFFNFIITELTTLDNIVVKLATEIDNLRGT